MEWKHNLTRTPYLVLFIVLISIGVGTASALITITLAGNVIITDDLTVGGKVDVTGGTITNERPVSDGNTDNIAIQRSGGPTSENIRFVFSQRTSDKDLWLYGFDGTTFKNFVGFDFPNYMITFPSTGDTLVIDGANDKVGIGTTTPQEKLEVNGNIRATGLEGIFNVTEKKFTGVSGPPGSWSSVALGDASDRMCFLVTVQRYEPGSDYSFGACKLQINDGIWYLNATGEGPASFQSAYCEAQCLTWK